MKTLFSSLSKFERALWIFSVMSITAAFVMSGCKEWLTASASLIGVTALIFVAKVNVIGQVLTVVFAVFYGIISFFMHYYGEMITYMCMTAPIALLAVISWIRHPYKGTKEVAVGRLTAGRVIFMIATSAAVTAAFYFILKALGNACLILSTISITTSYIASYLTYCRSEYYALAYAANDIILICLWIVAALDDTSYLSMVVCFVMFLANDLYGYYNWQSMRRRQSGSITQYIDTK